MSEEEQVDQLVGRYDEDASRYLLTGWLSGPAGSASVDLADGRVVVDVDYASPGTISHIEVEASHASLPGDVSRSLTALTGVSDLGRRLRGLDETPRLIWARDRDRWSLPQLNVAGPLGRLALLIAEYDNSRRSDTARAAAALEAANLLGDLDPDLLVDRQPTELWREAVRLLGDTSSPSPGDLRSPLLVAAERSASVDSELSGQLERLARDLEPTQRVAFAMMTPDLASMIEPPARRKRGAARPATTRRAGGKLDVKVEVAPDLDVSPSAASLADGVLRVGATGTASERTKLYLRVFRNGSFPIPLAVVPFASTRFDGANATAVVPRELGRDDLVVEVTDTPGAPPLLPSVRSVMRAVRIGRDASRHARRGDEPDAADQWKRCASEWNNLGDDRRANLAIRYARNDCERESAREQLHRRRQRFTQPEEPLLSDLVD